MQGRLRRGPSRAVVVAAAVVVLVAVAGGAYAIVRGSRGPSHPDSWDPRVQPLADWVAKQRDLEFDKPVYVEFMSPAEYSDKTRGSDNEDVSKGDQQDLDDAVGEIRSLGLVEGKVDLGAAGKELADSGTLAFYDEDTERIYVRGTEMTPALRVTLAHELTHVLQDQHFDLKRLHDLPDAQATALRAVAEGDADHTEAAYVETLSDEDKASYEKQQQTDSEESKAALDGKVPPILSTVFGAPYVFGGRFVEAIHEADSSTTVDDVLRDPPKSEEQLLDPFTYLAGDEPKTVEAPSVPAGAKELQRETFGSLTWYLMLSERLDDKEALKAVDGWGGDQYVIYRMKDGKVCTAARFEGDTPEDTDEMRAALTKHADQVRFASGGAANFVVDGEGDAVDFRSCDPGPDAKLGVTGKSDDALGLPIVRTDIATAIVKEGGDKELASCYAAGVVDRLPLETLTSDDPAVFGKPEVAEAITQARLACR